MNEEEKIIEAEIVSETLDAKAETKVQSVKADNYGEKIERYVHLAGSVRRVFYPLAVLSAIAFFAFAILNSQADSTFYRIMFIVFGCVFGVSLVGLILTRIFYYRAVHLMGKDPNYEKYVK